jgi:hypothetical protein
MTGKITNELRKQYFERYPNDKKAFDEGIISSAISRRVRKFLRENDIPTGAVRATGEVASHDVRAGDAEHPVDGGEVMSQFKKLPVEIEAVRITKKTEIQTREGILYGYPGEWLITGVQGEKYPCGDEIFRQTYQPSGPDKCRYCIYGPRHEEHEAPCDMHETCVFEWPPVLVDITIGTGGANR